jgi:hypothetical protein
MNPALMLQKALLGLVLVALGFGIWQSQRWMRAGVLFEQSQRYQEAWGESPDLLTAENWLAAGENLFAALQLNPREADYLHRYGILLDSERSLPGLEVTQEQNLQILSNVIEAHLLGIQQRPADPYGWTYFARAKALAGQLDSEFDLALERINVLAPWEKQIHQTIASIAVYYWPNMSDNGKYFAAAILQRALSNPDNAAAVRPILQDSDLLPLLTGGSDTPATQ